MRSKTQRYAGRHRKATTSQTAKGRIALMTVTAGAVSAAGVGGAAAAQLQLVDEGLKTQTLELVNDSTDFADLPTETTPEAAEAAIEADLTPRVLTVAEEKPVEDLLQQIGQAIEAADARAAADAAMRLPSIVKPAEGAFTSPFGPRWGTLHAGIDIANANGTPILAIMDGVVVDSGPVAGFGNWIRILHGDGSISLYGHMETLDVSVGDVVHAGQKIAGMGNVGFSTGTHLHFEIHPTGNGAVDPVPWFASRGVFIN